MKNRRAIIFFGLALLFGAAAAYTARHLIESRMAHATPSTVDTKPVVIARGDLSIAVALRSSQLETVEWPAAYVPTNAFQDPSQIDGRVPRRAIASGEPVLASSLLPVGSEAGLASVIEEELRAVSVKVDPVIGVAGFVDPGARVDVLATLRRIDQPKKLPYSKVILQDVPVLAIDQKMETAEDGEPELVSVVTLEVKPSDAEKLIYSAHEGQLQLALRSPGDHEVVKTVPIGVADLLGRRPSRKKAYRATTTVQVLKGSTVNNASF